MNLVYLGFVLDKLNASFIPHLLSQNRNNFKTPIHPPPLGDIRVLSIGIRARSLTFRLHRLESKMSTRGLGYHHTLIFDGTNYDIWKIRMLNCFRVIDPNIERILDMGFSPPKDSQCLSLEDEKNSYLDAQVSNLLFDVVSNVVIFSIMPYRNAHEMWTKLKKKYDVSKIIEDDCIPSTSGRDEFSSSSTSPTCDLSQGNDMVSGGENCNVDIGLTIDNTSSLSHCNISSLDFNTYSTKNALHACVDSPCISSRNC